MDLLGIQFSVGETDQAMEKYFPRGKHIQGLPADSDICCTYRPYFILM
jgi:hypothetical protein